MNLNTEQNNTKTSKTSSQVTQGCGHELLSLTQVLIGQEKIKK